MLPWNKNVQQWRARIMLLRGSCVNMENNPWPDLSNDALLRTMESWLLPHLGPVRRIEDFQT